MTPRILHALLHFVQCHVQRLRQFGCGWWALKLLLQARKRFVDFVDRANLVQRESNNSALLCQGLKNGLANPPNRVRDELETTGFVKPLCGLDEPQVAFVDQIRQRQSLVLVLLGHRDHKSEVGFGQLLQCGLVSCLDLAGEFHLFLRSNQVNTANLLEVFVQRRGLPVGDLLGDF